MKAHIALLVAAGLVALGCSKNNDVQEISPLVLETLDGELDAGPDAQASAYGGLAVLDAGAEEAPAPPAPEDFEESAERDITSDTLEAELKALESELSSSVPAG